MWGMCQVFNRPLSLFYEVGDGVDLFIELLFGVVWFMTGGFLGRGGQSWCWSVVFIAGVGGLMNDVEELGVFSAVRSWGVCLGGVVEPV